MKEESKPRGRRRGGRARSQQQAGGMFGGTLANLHGRKIILEDEDEAPQKKKASSSRPKPIKEMQPVDEPIVVVKSQKVVEKQQRVESPIKDQHVKVSTEATQQQQLVDSSKHASSPPSNDKENNSNTTSFASPAKEQPPHPLSPSVQSPTFTPPLTSVKLKQPSSEHPSLDGNSNSNHIKSFLSPLSTASSYCNESPASSNNDVDNDCDEDEDESELSKVSVQEEESCHSSPDSQRSNAMSEEASDNSMNSADETRDDSTNSSGEQSYDDEDIGEDDAIEDGECFYQGESAEEDEDFSMEEEEESDSDEELEFDDEESETRPGRKRRGKKKEEEKQKPQQAEDQERLSDTESLEEESAANESIDESQEEEEEEDYEEDERIISCEEESQASSSNSLKECKVNLDARLEDSASTASSSNEELHDANEVDFWGNSEFQPDEPAMDPIVEPAVEPIDEIETDSLSDNKLEIDCNLQAEEEPEPSQQKTGTKDELDTPTQSELFEVVDNLFRDADKETVTVKDIVRAVADNFNLTKIEKSMKKMIKSRLTDLIQGIVVLEDDVADMNATKDGQKSVIEPPSCSMAKDDNKQGDEIHERVEASTFPRQEVADDFVERNDSNDVECEVESPNESTELQHSSTDISFGEIEMEVVPNDATDGATQDNGETDDSSVSAEKAKCPLLDSHAAEASEREMLRSTQEVSPQHPEIQQRGSAESKNEEQAADQSLCHVQPVTEEVLNMSDTLFQNLSPDMSVKSSAPPRQQNERSNLMDSMSMSNSFGDSMKSRSVVEKGKWNLGSEIGVGSFGRVYMGMNAVNGSMMAVKVLQIPSNNKHAIVEDLQREIDLMRTLKHPNIVRYLGAEVDNSKNILHIFQEWAPGGSISSLLKKFGPFSTTVVKTYLAQILKGLQYLHSHGILHRDIKGGNILVSNDGSIKLADFGASKRVEAIGAESDEMEMTMRGTPYFMAPEVMEEKYGSKADIWSVGGVVYQMITGSPPWKGMGFKSPIALFMHLQKHDGPPKLPQLKQCDSHDHQLLESILSRCFQRNPALRPNASTLMNDSFLSKDHFGPVPKSPLAVEIPTTVQDLHQLTGNASVEFMSSPKPTFQSPLGQIPEDEAMSSTNGPTFQSPFNQIPEDEALNNSLADSLCYSLTLQSPLRIDINETKDTSAWPDWAAKRSNKENQTAASRSASKKSNPYAKKKTPLATKNLNVM